MEWCGKTAFAFWSNRRLFVPMYQHFNTSAYSNVKQPVWSAIPSNAILDFDVQPPTYFAQTDDEIVEGMFQGVYQQPAIGTGDFLNYRWQTFWNLERTGEAGKEETTTPAAEIPSPES
jgi:hypothetical protein